MQDDPERDYALEAWDIIMGRSRLLATREHLIALDQEHKRVLKEIIRKSEPRKEQHADHSEG